MYILFKNTPLPISDDSLHAEPSTLPSKLPHGIPFGEGAILVPSSDSRNFPIPETQRLPYYFLSKIKSEDPISVPTYDPIAYTSDGS